MGAIRISAFRAAPAYRVFARRAALSARFEHGGGRHGVGTHAEQLRALRQKRRKRGDDGAADAAALSVQNDDGHNCLRIVKSFVNSGNRFRQNRPRACRMRSLPASISETENTRFSPAAMARMSLSLTSPLWWE